MPAQDDAPASTPNLLWCGAYNKAMRHPLYALLLLPLAGILILVFYPRRTAGDSYVPDLPGSAPLPAVYDKTTLFDYMDGGAEAFLQNGFVSLKVWTGKAGTTEWTAELYLFGSPDQAGRIFDQFRSGAETRSGGAVQAADKGSACAHAGVFFLRVFTYPEDNGLPARAVQHFLRWCDEQDI